MQYYRFGFIFFFMLVLSSYGCKYINFSEFFLKKTNYDSTDDSIESEILPAPVPEEEYYEDNNSVITKDNTSIRMGIIGAWKISHKNGSCSMILTLTRFKNNFRGTAVNCNGRLVSLSAWNIIDEDTFEIKNKNGKNIVVFHKIDQNSFEGYFVGEKSSNDSPQDEDDKLIISR
ncbi:AprI/Inh family metalloprotease inhibitor [Candidatus Liberibacter africanus]|uniref:Outer membrane lipoprotein omp19 n=1 Tax=Candidatus Liberibacter africanus PTSAPSY TaxID=1277257 RepID=A0A0G3I3W4_LIBAF|nr:AprI/Inh family metalloprotease inhibitor [Candidatus Liberibacter africanus]AKK20564.1 outer membrane lipoprotein omp19 [Candidatus Liberibacter africanus PTSAPSY]QTP64263.1 AprI/Inh family metalloprotease inhibitor [Candidatus Liberibacter africanus]